MIKRYPNRKLYDTEAKRYVTLEQITQMIEAGHEVQVIDNESGEDLTNLTLSQIIFEREKKGSGLLSRTLLTNLIRAGSDTLEQVRKALLAGPEKLAETTIEAIPGKVDHLMQDVLQSINVPTARDLDRLQVQLDELNGKLARLLSEQTTGQPQDAIAGDNQPGAPAKTTIDKPKRSRVRKQATTVAADQPAQPE
jgi:polyhydroxyalkanoate synthesis repressor PhaR